MLFGLLQMIWGSICYIFFTLSKNLFEMESKTCFHNNSWTFETVSFVLSKKKCIRSNMRIANVEVNYIICSYNIKWLHKNSYNSNEKRTSFDGKITKVPRNSQRIQTRRKKEQTTHIAIIFSANQWPKYDCLISHSFDSKFRSN